MQFSVLAALIAGAIVSQGAVVPRVDSRIPVVRVFRLTVALEPSDLTLEAAQAKWTKYCVTLLFNELGEPGDDTYTPYPYAQQAPDIYTTPALNVFCSAGDAFTSKYTNETIAWLGWEHATYAS
ncbi:hypothetical protein DL96DRAFT_1559444 [Flagelloscypha sp. PMI_526]|nr:hypothetical protein DL96DRAFT_1559444 [Flagelloscypha sp. PMI_526]